MANTAAVASVSLNHITYLLTGDGTVAGPTIANATLLADMIVAGEGPLYQAWNTPWVTQAAMRTALLGGGAQCVAEVQVVATPVDTTAQVNQIAIDVDTDAVTVTKAEINVQMSDTTGQLAYLTLSHWHSIVK